MSQICEICGKKPTFGNNVSHSHKKTPRRWNPNIQSAQVLIEGKPKKVKICTRCLKKYNASA